MSLNKKKKLKTERKKTPTHSIAFSGFHGISFFTEMHGVSIKIKGCFKSLIHVAFVSE